MKKIININKIIYIEKFKLEISFSDGKIKTIDFADFILNSKKPDVKKYQKPAQFKKFNFKNGELMWGDFEMIFPVSDLYKGAV
jgi:hypothetical protein